MRKIALNRETLRLITPSTRTRGYLLLTEDPYTTLPHTMQSYCFPASEGGTCGCGAV